MEADISILRKTGHFYFALTRSGNIRRPLAAGPLPFLPAPGGDGISDGLSLLCRQGHFFFRSAVQLVTTFKGRVLVSGATLPTNRGAPPLGSTSNI